MGKMKVKRRGLSESTAQKSATPKKKINPFEIQVNRQKYNVIGYRSKSDKGLPGISRSKAVQKRKATLLLEYRGKDKSNKFFDRRIGEKDKGMTYEDRAIARFTAERTKMFKNKQIYNLADDEILTHHGKTLSEIEKFEDPRSDEEELDDPGRLGADFVEDAHFGGGKKTEHGEKKSRKDLIEQLIAESKKRKAEKQRTREHTIELTEKLDTEWQDLLPVVAASKKKPTEVEQVEKPDSYDTMMRELKFEARAQASEPLKAEDEIQEEEKKMRALLEEERMKRMKVFTDVTVSSRKHRSADDLDDGIAIDEEEGLTVSYNLDGNLLAAPMEKVSGADASTNRSQSPVDIEKSDEMDDSESEGDEDEETEDSLSDLKPSSGSETEDDGEMGTSSIQSDPNGGEKCQKDEKEWRSEEDNNVKGNYNVAVKSDTPTPKRWIIVAGPVSENDKKVFLQELERKDPFFIDIPEKYGTFHKLLKQYKPEKQAVIVSHIIEKNHVGLHELNRSRLETLFSHVLKHILITSSKDVEEGLQILNCLAPHLFDLCQLSPECSSRMVQEILKEKQEAFQKHKHKYPNFDTLILFKIISLLFPTSDFRHPVVSPAKVFMCQMLFQCRVKSRRDIASGLFLVALILEFTVFSKRFSPAAINFLCGMLHLSIPKRPIEAHNILPVPPFRRIGLYSDLLVLETKIGEEEETLKMNISDLSEDSIDTSCKIRVLATTLSMLNEFLSNLSNLQACPSIFHFVNILLNKVPLENYPDSVQSKIKKLLIALQNLKGQTIQYLIQERKRPKALRLYEPSFPEVFDGKRKRTVAEEELEKEKLLHKIKREKKAAIREIRRDNSFLAKVRWRETVQSDMERMQKVKEIFGSAASQLGELRALERKKKRLK